MKRHHASATILLVLVVLSSSGVAVAQMDANVRYSAALKQIKGQKYELASEALKEIIEEYPTFDRAYSKLLTVYQQTGQAEAARSYFIELLAASGNPYPHYGLALVFKQRREFSAAEAEIRNTIQAAPEFAPAYKELVEIALSRGNLDATIQSLQTATQLEDANAAAHYGLGYAYQQQQEWQKALAQHQVALTRKPALLEPLIAQFQIFYQTDQLGEAQRILRIVAVQVDQDSDLDRKVRTLGNLGIVSSDLADYDQARDYLTQSVEIARDLGDRVSEQAYLANLGVVFRYLGQYANSLKAYEQALSIARALGDRVNEGRNLGLRAGIHTQLGNYPEALSDYDKALEVARSVGDRDNEATLLSSAGLIIAALADYPKAFEYLDSAIKIAREVKNPWIEGRSQWVLGVIHEKVGEHGKALSAYEEGLRVSRTVDDKVAEADGLARIGRVKSNLGDDKQAFERYQQALKLSQDIGARSIEGDVLNQLGKLHLKLAEYQQATNDHQKALTIGSEIHMPEMVWQAHAGLGAAYERQRLYEPTLRHYRLAIEALENVRAKIELPEEKAGFFQEKIGIYQDLIETLLTLDQTNPSTGHAAEAFHYTERARARAFLDLLAEAKVRVEEESAPSVIERQRLTQVRIAQVQSQLINEHQKQPSNQERIKAIETQLGQADEERQKLLREIRHDHPRYAELQYPVPINLEQLQKSLTENSLVLEYSLGEKSSYLFAVSKDRFLVARLPPAAQLIPQVEKLRQSIESPAAGTYSNFIVLAQSLHKELIQPAATMLEGKQELIIIPDGVLHYLPYEVLLGPGGVKTTIMAPDQLPYLVSDYAISYAPSASVFVNLAERHREGKQTATKTLLAFADPVYDEFGLTRDKSIQPGLRSSIVNGKQSWRLDRLKQSRDEVQRIAQLYGAGDVGVFLGEDASEENVKAGDRMGNYRIIHFAVHSLLNEVKPQYTALVLSLPDRQRTQRGRLSSASKVRETSAAHAIGSPAEDGLLQIYELFNLKLNADLVVLSACETALGKDVKGEGLIGLTRAFMYAGAPSVVASLWKVADHSTAELMVSFHGHLKKGKVNKAEALRQAKLELIRAGRFSHPYYWAPFVLIGKP